MPPGRLLDTSVVVPMLRGEVGLKERLLAGRNYLSSTIVGELFLGALLSNRSAENFERCQRLAASIVVLPCDGETAKFYAELGLEPENQGRRIPQNDLWIAAVARQHELTLVHRNLHFAQLEGFAQESWD